MNLLAFLSMPGGSEWIVILLVALIIFGRRLPEVSRSIGKSIVEFKKGMQDVHEQVEAPLPAQQQQRIEAQPSPSNTVTASPAPTAATEPSTTPSGR